MNPAEIARNAAERRRAMIENLKPARREARARLETLHASVEAQTAAIKSANEERELLNGHHLDLFATPHTLAARMAELADLSPNMEVLEPSAGTGRLADACLPYGVTPICVEWSYDAFKFLANKGHVVYHCNFMEWEPPYHPNFDRVIMNPPFSNGNDIDHVRHAAGMLKTGGKLIAIMGEGAFIRNDRRAVEFRAWLDGIGGTSEKLPDGSFNQSGTGVNTRLVIINL